MSALTLTTTFWGEKKVDEKWREWVEGVWSGLEVKGKVFIPFRWSFQTSFFGPVGFLVAKGKPGRRLEEIAQ